MNTFLDQRNLFYEMKEFRKISLSSSVIEARMEGRIPLILGFSCEKCTLHLIMNFESFQFQNLCKFVMNKLFFTAYNAENLVHEQQLLQLWSLLQPGVPLMTRKTKQWQNIGFQGDDPKTDFRGMGLLGLENLL